jgi:Tfp pilus assembly protein PilO
MKRPDIHFDPKKTSNLLGTYAMAGILILLLASFLFIKPSLEKASARKRELNQYRDHIAALEQLDRDTAAMRTEFSVLDAEKERIVTLVPPGNDEAGLVKILDTMARKTGVTLGSIAPNGTSAQSLSSPVVAAGDIVPYPLTISVAGTYPQIFNFINALENGPRIMQIRNVQFSSKSSGLLGGATGVSVTFEIDTYTQSLPVTTVGGGN